MSQDVQKDLEQSKSFFLCQERRGYFSLKAIEVVLEMGEVMYDNTERLPVMMST